MKEPIVPDEILFDEALTHRTLDIFMHLFIIWTGCCLALANLDSTY